VSATFESLGRLTGWLEKLDGMRASDRLDEDAARDMLFDVERSYNAFYRYLDAM
jgi:ESCRT-I complex subunit VPS28